MESIVKYPATILSNVASAVEEPDEDLAALIMDMYTVMDDYEAVGVAAPQVGVDKRVFVFDDREGNRGELLNPIITHSAGHQYGSEGCLSLPGVWLDIARANQVYVAGSNLEGSPISHEATGLLARIFQHEIDHLNGGLIINLVPRAVRRAALKHLKAV